MSEKRLQCDGCLLYPDDVSAYWPGSTCAVWALCGTCRERARLIDPKVGHSKILQQLFEATHGPQSAAPTATAPSRRCPLCDGTGHFP